jgi:hypothetical protein
VMTRTRRAGAASLALVTTTAMSIIGPAAAADVSSPVGAAALEAAIQGDGSAVKDAAAFHTSERSADLSSPDRPSSARTAPPARRPGSGRRS